MRRTSPYSRSDEAAIRNFMAIDRTALANERTFLAYMRTVFTMVIAGVSFVKLFSTFVFQIIGVVILLLAGILFLFSFYKYFHRRKYIRRTKTKKK